MVKDIIIDNKYIECLSFGGGLKYVDCTALHGLINVKSLIFNLCEIYDLNLQLKVIKFFAKIYENCVQELV